MGSDIKDLTAQFVAQNGSRDLNAANVSSFLQQLSSGGAYNPQAAFNTAQQRWSQSPQDAYAALSGANNGIMADAGRYADASVMPYGQSLQTLAAQQSQQAVQNMSQKMSQGGVFGTDSGAARVALMQGAMQPYAAADAQLAAKRADAYSAYALPQQQMAAQNYYGAGDRYAALGGNYFNALNGLSQQAYLAPQFQQQSSKGSNALSSAASGALIGTQIMPGWGTAIGGALGGLGGYFG